MNAANVEKVSFRRAILLYISELTLERNHMAALNVVRPSARRLASLHISDFTQERLPLCVPNVENPVLGNQDS